MAKGNFLNEGELFMSESFISQLHGIQVIKPENEGTLFME